MAEEFQLARESTQRFVLPAASLATADGNQPEQDRCKQTEPHTEGDVGRIEH